GRLSRQEPGRIGRPGETALHGETDVARAHLAFGRHQHRLLGEVEAAGRTHLRDGRYRGRGPADVEHQVHVRVRPGRLDGDAAARALKAGANGRPEQPRGPPVRGRFADLRA